MTQIFRIDNPLMGRGLSLAQRICYLNGMMHFFYGIPRLVFLTAPLSFLFFGAHVIQASAVTIALFAMPHMLHANATNSRMQSQFRHSFWAEVYESVLASYITPPTLLALINPKLGKFNVTAKGGMIEQKYFDWAISRPYLLLLILNLLGFLIGLWHIHTHWSVRSEVYTTILNLGWTTYNMLILGASVAAAAEQKQVRAVHRVAMKMPVMLRFGTGRTLACETIDYSEGGVGVALPQNISVPLHERVTVSLFRGDERIRVPRDRQLLGAGPCRPALRRDDQGPGIQFREDHLRARRRVDRLGRGQEARRAAACARQRAVGRRPRHLESLRTPLCGLAHLETALGPLNRITDCDGR